MYSPSLVSAVTGPGAPSRRVVTGALMSRVGLGEEHVRLSQPSAEVAAGRALDISL